MCLTIVDTGEGQSPDRLPTTILSLNAKNKQRVRFVQGKFNMGGSGTLRFCGEHGLQLVISRRDPGLLDRANRESNLWGVTIVRREAPSNRSGEPVHSEFTYLAPQGVGEAGSCRGGVLRFEAGSLPLMPQHDEPYVRKIAWGTAIKLYEYETRVGQSNVLMKDGLLYSLERLLPEICLPVRVHECRGYEGVKDRSFETTLAGLLVRLEDGKGDNLEPGFPISARVSVDGMEMTARIYAFKEARASTYLRDEGVIFTINGQAHGYLPKSIFSRPKAVGLQRLKDSLLVLVDCSGLAVTQREDLFMSSRDRLSKKPIRYRVERELELMLKNNPELKRLQMKRRSRDVEEKLSEERPLEEVLRKVLRSSPTLKSLFLVGQRLARPFPGSARGKNGGKGSEDGTSEFVGRRFPTYFRIEGREYGKVFSRSCEVGRRVPITFETDAQNDYFTRDSEPGQVEVEAIESSVDDPALDYSLTLDSGKAHLNLALDPSFAEGDVATLQVSVRHPTLPDPFVNMMRLTVGAKQNRSGGQASRKRRKGSGEDPGGHSQQGIDLPNVVKVREGDDNWRLYRFAPETACHVISEAASEESEQIEHTFYINVDNASLRTEMKYSKQDPRLLEAKFKYANVLLGLAMLHDDSTRESRDGERESIQEQIRRVTDAVAPVILPLIDQLAGLTDEDFAELSMAGEEV